MYKKETIVRKLIIMKNSLDQQLTTKVRVFDETMISTSINNLTSKTLTIMLNIPIGTGKGILVRLNTLQSYNDQNLCD